MLVDIGAENPPSEWGFRGPSEDFAETFRYSVGNLPGLGPQRDKWIADYAHSLTATRQLFQEQPFAACKPIPVPTP